MSTNVKGPLVFCMFIHLLQYVTAHYFPNHPIGFYIVTIKFMLCHVRMKINLCWDENNNNNKTFANWPSPFEPEVCSTESIQTVINITSVPRTGMSIPIHWIGAITLHIQKQTANLQIFAMNGKICIIVSQCIVHCSALLLLHTIIYYFVEFD